MSREQPVTPHKAWLALSPFFLHSFSRSSLCSLFSFCHKFNHFIGISAKALHKMELQTSLINSPLFLFSVFFSLYSIPDNGWRGWTMYSCHLTPSKSLDSTSTNICCVQSGFGQGGEGVDIEVKTISMQIVMTSCVFPFPGQSFSSSWSLVSSLGAAGKL